MPLGGICKLNGTECAARNIQVAPRKGSVVLAYALPAIAHAKNVMIPEGIKVKSTLRMLCVSAITNTLRTLATH
jgi:hypothetical protein